MNDHRPQPVVEPAPTLADELAKIEHEPLLPIEKALIAGSLTLGLVLLGILLWISATFYPVR
ncbi:hypothetical protein [Aquisphaera insulae]|uniref:hypothetical protein n=1 Tax=Aquisphaera insulae TaxID=2712864 RepID=UPI0013ED4123|nr:hypothetical protein [Aquisphaera insulae]